MTDSQVNKIVAAILTVIALEERCEYVIGQYEDLLNELTKRQKKDKEDKDKLKQAIIKKCEEIMDADAHDAAKLSKELRYLVGTHYPI